MEIEKEKSIYLISGSCGIGKSTIAKELSRNLKPSALIMGDEINDMLLVGSELPLEQRFSLTWGNIILLARNFVRNELNVVIEWVIQNDIEWICEQFSDLNIQIKYVVLRANEDKLMMRLGKRGDSHLIDRSLFLLNRLDNLPSNKRFLYDTTRKEPSEVVQDIISSHYFNVR